MIALPCGGTGTLRAGQGMRVPCDFHRKWVRDPRTGQWATELVRGELTYRFTDTQSCGAVTDLDPRTGQRVIVEEEEATV